MRRPAQWAAGCGALRYDRQGRRRTRRVITPRKRRAVPTIVMLIDTSASMDDDQLADSLGVVEGVVRATGAALTVLTCDAASTTSVAVRNARSVKLVGGGGTDLRVGITEAETYRPDVIVTVTDGGTPWPDQPTRARLVVAVTGGHSTEGVPSWASAVSVPPAGQEVRS